MHQNPSPYPSQISPNLQFPEHEHINCPRCDSNNTKFCYYNNYNLSQPRHYCKTCRRYWTKGGTLRKIPIGGGTRKSTKRSSTTSKRPADSSSSKSTVPPPQLKLESSSIASKSAGSFDSNLRDGSEKNELNGSGVIQVNCLSMNGGESSGGDAWPHLSIFTSGSNLR